MTDEHVDEHDDGYTGPIDAAHWDGIVAAAQGIHENPHTRESDEHVWWAWQIGYLSEVERREHDARPTTQVQKQIDEQPRWERAEAMGAHEIAKRIHHRTDDYVRWLGLRNVPGAVFEEYPRRLLREMVDQLLALGPKEIPDGDTRPGT